jgi:hypothetical protein
MDGGVEESNRAKLKQLGAASHARHSGIADRRIAMLPGRGSLCKMPRLIQARREAGGTPSE